MLQTKYFGCIYVYLRNGKYQENIVILKVFTLQNVKITQEKYEKCFLELQKNHVERI